VPLRRLRFEQVTANVRQQVVALERWLARKAAAGSKGEEVASLRCSFHWSPRCPLQGALPRPEVVALKEFALQHLETGGVLKKAAMTGAGKDSMLGMGEQPRGPRAAW
jgi:hypothetical protein